MAQVVATVECVIVDYSHALAEGGCLKTRAAEEHGLGNRFHSPRQADGGDADTAAEGIGTQREESLGKVDRDG